MRSLVGAKRVLVTGASQGIGRDLAFGFALDGESVILAARNGDALRAVQAEIQAVGGKAMAFTCDVTEADSVADLSRAINEHIGGIDILVNSAGAAGSHKFLRHPDALWHQMLAVNLTGAYYVTKAFAEAMLTQRWGRIIYIASTAALVGGKYIAAYTAAKHGVLGLTRALAVELAPHVTVNAICPGYVDSPMTDNTLATIVQRTGMTKEEAIRALTRGSAQKRLIQPNEITALARYLASGAAEGVTGQAIVVDGGRVMT